MASSNFQALADIVKDHISSERACSKQLTLRCPMCVNTTCGMAKEFYASQQEFLDELNQAQALARKTSS